MNLPSYTVPHHLIHQLDPLNAPQPGTSPVVHKATQAWECTAGKEVNITQIQTKSY